MFTPDTLGPVWRRLSRDDVQGLADAARELACCFPFDLDAFEEDEAYLYLPVSSLTREADDFRYLQNSLITSLNVKQNQIVKVFTIITAVFLPPTLVATFYGMNFSVKPELDWVHGFAFTIVLTLLAALLPLLYIKHKGWLR